jgi:hypothetical protein
VSALNFASMKLSRRMLVKGVKWEIQDALVVLFGQSSIRAGECYVKNAST